LNNVIFTQLIKMLELMKKTLLAASVLLSVTGIAQTFSDNFDSYTAGQYMAAQSGGAWTTWSNAPGTAEDVMVSAANSVSGNNSIYFSTTAQTGDRPCEELRRDEYRPVLNRVEHARREWKSGIL
jgi:hypothetical protein